MELDGVPVVEDMFGHAGQPGSYRRIVVRCPCTQTTHHVLHKACEKRRGLGANQRMHFGELEPFGFLGAWLAARDRFPDRRSHMAYVPNVAAVSAYMDAAGLARSGV